MVTDSTLLAVLDDWERHSRVAVVRFIDGEVYNLRVISTKHAEEGGAEVVGVASSSAPVGLRHRALGLREGETITWFWIGSHAEYDTLLARL